MAITWKCLECNKVQADQELQCVCGNIDPTAFEEVDIYNNIDHPEPVTMEEKAPAVETEPLTVEDVKPVVEPKPEPKPKAKPAPEPTRGTLRTKKAGKKVAKGKKK